MNTTNRNLSSTTTFRRDEKTNSITSTVRYNTARIPTPEPRRRLSHREETTAAATITTTTDQCHSLETSQDVTNKPSPVVRPPPRHIPIRIEKRYEEPPRQAAAATAPRFQKRKISCDPPIDEGVCSPSNMGYESEDGAHEDYEEEEEVEDGFGSSDPVDELTNLSRQSMVPLHELIAYYQYIQRGDAQDNQLRERVSRQSSNASQPISQADSNAKLSDDTDHPSIKNSLEDESDNPSSCEAKVLPRTLPKVLIENVDEIDSVAATTAEIIQCSKDKRRIRANVVLELINSERDFVKHLRDVVEGYLYPARKHPEIFTFDRINTIFANIEQLYDFQRKFLQNLELSINWDDPASSEVGECFLKFEHGFSVYHYYCNNHPNASSELQELYAKPRFVKFFEACRVLQNMIDISLDGFLLTPIQKICKYPLQLNELLKNTEEDHPDFKPVADALESMRNCANVANERKRRIEALADVISFQERVENWAGPKLCDTSSILIHSGEVSKITSQMKSHCIQLHLFDHLLLFSKKDLLKRNTLIYKARVNMDAVTKIADADEYKPKRGFKLYCGEQEKWFVFTARTEKERDDWIRAFERERNLVASDENEGFHITGREIGVARRTLQSRKHSRSARYRLKRPDTAIVDQLDIEDANTIMNRTLSLPSCMHPSHVMNFVEDSKVVSSRKKSSSPSSPHQGSQNLVEQENQSAGGGWFKKMGSKKIPRGQVNNNVSVVPTTKSTTSPTANSVINSASSNKYDELEKRHRDHMISEEQARLFRLNNDLPASSLVKSHFSHRSSIDRGSTSIKNNRNMKQTQKHAANDIQSQTYIDPSDLDFRAMGLSSTDSTSNTKAANELKLSKKEAISIPDETSFEATMVLPSGRVVRVREDAV